MYIHKTKLPQGNDAAASNSVYVNEHPAFIQAVAECIQQKGGLG